MGNDYKREATIIWPNDSRKRALNESDEEKARGIQSRAESRERGSQVEPKGWILQTKRNKFLIDFNKQHKLFVRPPNSQLVSIRRHHHISVGSGNIPMRIGGQRKGLSLIGMEVIALPGVARPNANRHKYGASTIGAIRPIGIKYHPTIQNWCTRASKESRDRWCSDQVFVGMALAAKGLERWRGSEPRLEGMVGASFQTTNIQSRSGKSSKRGSRIL